VGAGGGGRDGYDDVAGSEKNSLLGLERTPVVGDLHGGVDGSGVAEGNDFVGIEAVVEVVGGGEGEGGAVDEEGAIVGAGVLGVDGAFGFGDAESGNAVGDGMGFCVGGWKGSRGGGEEGGDVGCGGKVGAPVGQALVEEEAVGWAGDVGEGADEGVSCAGAEGTSGADAATPVYSARPSLRSRERSDS